MKQVLDKYGAAGPNLAWLINFVCGLSLQIRNKFAVFK